VDEGKEVRVYMSGTPTEFAAMAICCTMHAASLVFVRLNVRGGGGGSVGEHDGICSYREYKHGSE
jgi:hypothetical protein